MPLSLEDLERRSKQGLKQAYGTATAPVTAADATGSCTSSNDDGSSKSDERLPLSADQKPLVSTHKTKTCTGAASRPRRTKSGEAAYGASPASANSRSLSPRRRTATTSPSSTRLSTAANLLDRPAFGTADEWEFPPPVIHKSVARRREDLLQKANSLGNLLQVADNDATTNLRYQAYEEFVRGDDNCSVFLLQVANRNILRKAQSQPKLSVDNDDDDMPRHNQNWEWRSTSPASPVAPSNKRTSTPGLLGMGLLQPSARDTLTKSRSKRRVNSQEKDNHVQGHVPNDHPTTAAKQRPSGSRLTPLEPNAGMRSSSRRNLSELRKSASNKSLAGDDDAYHPRRSHSRQQLLENTCSSHTRLDNNNHHSGEPNAPRRSNSDRYLLAHADCHSPQQQRSSSTRNLLARRTACGTSTSTGRPQQRRARAARANSLRDMQNRALVQHAADAN